MRGVGGFGSGILGLRWAGTYSRRLQGLSERRCRVQSLTGDAGIRRAVQADAIGSGRRRAWTMTGGCSGTANIKLSSEVT